LVAGEDTPREPLALLPKRVAIFQIRHLGLRPSSEPRTIRELSRQHQFLVVLGVLGMVGWRVELVFSEVVGGSAYVADPRLRKDARVLLIHQVVYLDN